MKFFAAAAASMATMVQADVFSSETVSAFKDFKVQFRKAYESMDHERLAMSAFAANLIRAEQRNNLGSAVHGITQFMDLTPEEFKSQYLNYRSSTIGQDRLMQKDLPRAAHAIDWSNTTKISHVKDQGQCGSCWAFSTTEQIETVYALTNDVDAPRFSTQQVVACDSESLGCNGGDTVSGFAYLKNFGGIEKASDYPDTSSRGGRSGKCHADKSLVVPGTQVDQVQFCIPECMNGDCDKTQRDTETAKACITKSPQSICVNAEAWQTYVRGVMTDRECGDHSAASLDHCVQVVGYDATAPTPYYIVRNSWNTNWGLDGLIHLGMDGNTCGILSEMTTVTLK